MISCKNIEADDSIRDKVEWIEEEDKRIEALSEIISFTSGSDLSLNIIYENYRKLDFWKELYKDEKKFKKEFKKAENMSKDSTKPYTRYQRWSKIFEKLPVGSYLSCSIPNSYWRLITAKNYKDLISVW